MKTFVFGEIIWDEYPNDLYIGGASLNFSAHLANLGADVYLCSAVGNDENGDNSIKMLQKSQINYSYIMKNIYPTGSCKVILDNNKKPTFNLNMNSAFDHIELGQKEFNSISDLNADVLYFGTLIQRNSISQNTLYKILDICNFSEIFCDINMRKNCWSLKTLEYCFEKATILKMSRDEVTELTDIGFLPQTPVNNLVEKYKYLGEFICKKYQNIKLLLITLDEDGAVVFENKTNRCFYSPSKRVKVCSTVGAGDSFGAAFLNGYLGGETLEKCLDRAIKLSSFVVSKNEAVPQYTADIFIN